MPNSSTNKLAGYYKRDRPEMLDFIPSSSGKILDVGCGEGCFGLKLKKLGMEVWGIELNRESAVIAQKKLNRVIIGDVFNLIDDLPDHYFDCVVFNDVLEHLIDPFTLLMKLKKKLSAKGFVVASIPNVRYFYNLKNLVIKKQWKYEDDGILDKTHLRFFTKDSIRETFNLLGYEVLRIEGIHAFNPSWMFKLLNLVLFGQLSDTKYLQFACVVRNKHELL